MVSLKIITPLTIIFISDNISNFERAKIFFQISTTGEDIYICSKCNVVRKKTLSLKMTEIGISSEN